MNGPPDPPPREVGRRTLTIAAVAALAAVLVAASVYVYSVLRSGEVEPSLWAVEMLHPPGSVDGSGVSVCVLDSGVDTSHESLAGVTIAAWNDLVDHRTRMYDDEGHGTYIISLIAGQGRIRGISPGVSLIVGKVISSSGTGQDADVAAGVGFCIDQGADIISLSLGGKSIPLVGTLTEQKVYSALALGIYVVASAGNDGPLNKDVSSPAGVPGVIAVAAVDRSGALAEFSSRGDNGPGAGHPLGRIDPNMKPEVSAPGVDISGAWPSGGYVVSSGTSQAAALVAGGLALVLSSHPEYARDGAKGGSSTTIEALKRTIMETCEPLDGMRIPHDDGYGYGLLNLTALDEGLG